MQAYETGLKSMDTRLVISPNSEFFRFFNHSGNAPVPALNRPNQGARDPERPQANPQGGDSSHCAACSDAWAADPGGKLNAR